MTTMHMVGLAIGLGLALVALGGVMGGCGDDTPPPASDSPSCTAAFGTPQCEDDSASRRRVPLCPGDSFECSGGVARPMGGALAAICRDSRVLCAGEETARCELVPTCDGG